MDQQKLYYVGSEREYKSLTKLLLTLKDDESEKTIYIDAGVYDIFKEYKEAGIQSPPDDVAIDKYFDYNVFLPLNTKLIGVGNVLLRFAPTPDEVTYAESITWAPLNIAGACHIENIEIFCKNGRYCIHDDSHNSYKNTIHYYKHVRCTYALGDLKGEKRLGLNNTIGNGMAQGCKFEFDDCTFRFIGDNNHSAFYTHDSGYENPENAPYLIFRHCLFSGGEGNPKVLRLQNLAKADMRINTRVESCYLDGGIYLTIYAQHSAQHFDVTLINSGKPAVLVDREEENRYPVNIYN